MGFLPFGAGEGSGASWEARAGAEAGARGFASRIAGKALTFLDESERTRYAWTL